MTKAYMLRQDGVAIPCMVHLYTMDDPDLSSEAEVAAFLIHTNSKDQDLAKHVLDAWMALLIEDTVSYEDDAAGIEGCIEQMLDLLPYKFAFELPKAQYLAIHRELNHYRDIDTYYEFIDNVRAHLAEIQTAITKSLNQQFCRVRYGGQYNSDAGNNTIWFRISSVGFNWANVIYIFTSEHRRSMNIQRITICRDYESDHGARDGRPEYFYKAKDGAVYYDMPVDEFLNEEHEHSLVFSSVDLNRGVLATIRQCLAEGQTLNEVYTDLRSRGVEPHYNTWKYLMRDDWKQCIEASEFMDTLHPRSRAKMMQVKRMIESKYPEIQVEDIDFKPRDNSKGKPVGYELFFKLKSEVPALDGLDLSIAGTTPLNNQYAESLFRQFKYEYDSYKEFRNIRV